MRHMGLSVRAEYAVRALLELAASEHAIVSAEQLSREQGIPGKHLEAVMTTMRRAGLVRNRRGPGGGYYLARPASEVSLADVVNAVSALE
jgi:Rrf2 family protein